MARFTHNTPELDRVVYPPNGRVEVAIDCARKIVAKAAGCRVEEVEITINLGKR